MTDINNAHASRCLCAIAALSALLSGCSGGVQGQRTTAIQIPTEVLNAFNLASATDRARVVGTWDLLSSQDDVTASEFACSRQYFNYCRDGSLTFNADTSYESRWKISDVNRVVSYARLVYNASGTPVSFGIDNNGDGAVSDAELVPYAGQVTGPFGDSLVSVELGTTILLTKSDETGTGAKFRTYYQKR